VILVAFKETLKGVEDAGFSIITADLVTETILNQVFTQAVSQNESFDILVRGVRLRAYGCLCAAS